jgi:hypothetical protein
VFSTVMVLKDIKTGEWLDDKFRHDFALRQWFGIPFKHKSRSSLG